MTEHHDTLTDDRDVLAELLELNPQAHARIMAAGQALLDGSPIPCPICRNVFEDRDEWAAHEPDCMEPLAVTVADLKDEMRDLKAALAGEVRTRRLVVVDDEGAERITAEVFNGHAMVRATADGYGVDMFASPATDLDPTQVGLNVTTEYDTAVAIWATSDGHPEIVVDAGAGERATLDPKGVSVLEPAT